MDDSLGDSLGDCLGGGCFVGWFGNWVLGLLVGINIRRAYVQASFYSRYVVVLLIFRSLELG